MKTVSGNTHADHDAGKPQDQQRFAAETVDRQDCDHRKNHVDDADVSRLHEGGIGADTALLEDCRRIKIHRVDAAGLLCDADDQADDQYQPELGAEQLPQSIPAALTGAGRAGGNFPQLAVDPRCRGDAFEASGGTFSLPV